MRAEHYGFSFILNDKERDLGETPSDFAVGPQAYIAWRMLVSLHDPASWAYEREFNSR